MNRQTIVRFLLSLLLLVSQQMAISHGLSHWGSSARAQTEENSKLSKSVAQDQSCEQCLVFAQIAGAVGSDARRFLTDGTACDAILAAMVPAEPAPPLTAFHSRAPPSFA